MVHSFRISDPEAADLPLAEDLSRCVHCGLCLEQCPTYLETGMETESPRGRLHLINALSEGRIQATERYARHVNLCLACRNCEAVCPSGVPFGRIIERARHQLQRDRPPGLSERLLRRLVFEQLLAHLGGLRRLAETLRWYQRAGLQSVVRRSGFLRALSPRLAEAEAMLPRLPSRFFPPGLQVFQARGERRFRVALFSGCVMPLLYARVHEATVRALVRNGCEVVVLASQGYGPLRQGCCGALNLHAGERAVAREMARRNVDAFNALGVDAVIVNSAGCGAALKEYHELLAHDATYREPARRFSSVVRDVSEFLVDLPLEPPGASLSLRVTLQESCHLSHAQRLPEPPRAVLGSIPGMTMIAMAHPDLCCGSAGLYSVTQPEMSRRVLDRRVQEIRDTGAEAVATSNPGCMLQLEYGLRQAGLRVAVRHVVELLDAAYAAEAQRVSV